MSRTWGDYRGLSVEDARPARVGTDGRWEGSHGVAVPYASGTRPKIDFDNRGLRGLAAALPARSPQWPKSK